MIDPNSPSKQIPGMGQSKPLVPPIYQSSVYSIPDLDAADKIMDGDAEGYFYARDGHPNAQILANQLANIESADWAAICSSGMAAISSYLLAVVSQGERIVAGSQLYGKTAQLLGSELSRYGVATTFVDVCNVDQVAKALETPAKILLVETLSNPLLRVPNISALAELCEKKKCKLLVDNTFATPAMLRPIQLGAHAVTESLTKMIGGHSDVTLGLICGSGELGLQMSGVISTWGFAANPFDCWLAQRGLATLELRMTAACANAARLAVWLSGQSPVARVIYPGLDNHPDHEIARKQFRGTFGNMLCFELAGGRDAVNRLMHAMPEIPFSPSLGHVTSTLSHPAATSHRYTSPAEKRRQGITDGLIRLSVGAEEYDQLEMRLRKGLADCQV